MGNSHTTVIIATAITVGVVAVFSSAALLVWIRRCQQRGKKNCRKHEPKLTPYMLTETEMAGTAGAPVRVMDPGAITTSVMNIRGLTCTASLGLKMPLNSAAEPSAMAPIGPGDTQNSLLHGVPDTAVPSAAPDSHVVRNQDVHNTVELPPPYIDRDSAGEQFCPGNPVPSFANNAT